MATRSGIRRTRNDSRRTHLGDVQGRSTHPVGAFSCKLLDLHPSILLLLNQSSGSCVHIIQLLRVKKESIKRGEEEYDGRRIVHTGQKKKTYVVHAVPPASQQPYTGFGDMRMSLCYKGLHLVFVGVWGLLSGCFCAFQSINSSRD